MDLLTLSFDAAFVSFERSSNFNENFSASSTLSSAFGLLARTASNSSLKSNNSSSSSTSSLQRSASLAQKYSQLDLSRISNRILVCSRCFQERQSSTTGKQNDPLLLAGFLTGRFHDSYLLWNFGTPESLNATSSSIFGAKLVPITLPRTQHPTLKQLFHVCHGILGWLQMNSENVVVIQCSDGITRSGLIVACLLRFCGAFGSTFEALDYFCARRQVSTSADPRQNPSIRRLLRYFNDTCVLSGRVPQPLPLSLHQIIINSVPNFDGEGSCAAGLEIFSQNVLIFTKEAFLQDSNHIAFKFDDDDGERVLVGDLQLHLFHTQERTRQRSTIAYFSLNTAFTQPGIVRFCASEMEIPFWEASAPVTRFTDASRPASKRFADSFSVDLILLENESHLNTVCSYESTVQINPAKNLIRLSQFHPGRPDRSLLGSLCLQGWSRELAKVALQVCGNDIHGAHEMLTSMQGKEKIEKLLKDFRKEEKSKERSKKKEEVIVQEESQNRDNSDHKKRETEDELVEKKYENEFSEEKDEFQIEETLSLESEQFNVRSNLLQDMLKVKFNLRENSPRLPSEAPSPQPDERRRTEDSFLEPEEIESSVASTELSLMSLSQSVDIEPSALTTEPSLMPLSQSVASIQSPVPPPAPPLPPPMPPIGIPIAPPPPRPRLKNSLNWRELKNIPSIDQTVWSELSSPGRSCFSKSDFEELFCVKPGDGLSRKSSIVKEEATGSDLPLIVDVRRANNVGIGLARFNKRFDSISDLLNSIKTDKEAFSFDDYCALAAILPTDDEAAALRLIKPADGLLERMGRAELFMYEVSIKHANLPFLLKVRQFQCSAPLDIAALEEKFNLITEALKMIKDSAALKLILKAALELGNLANYEYGRLKASFSSGVQAFTLDSLCHLHEVKSVDGSSNLLLFLVQSLLPAHPEICVVAEGEAWKELDTIKCWNGTFLLAEVEALKEECSQLLSLTEGSSEAPALEAIKTSLISLEPVSNEFVATWQVTRSYFGEDPRDPPAIFEDVSVFIGTCAEFSKNLSVAIKQQSVLKRVPSN